VRRVVCVGECMVELTELDERTLSLGFGGDTYNTAVYLKRVAAELGVELEVGYLTGLGTDDYSAAMREAWTAEGIVDRALVVGDRVPGLYAIRPSADGERRFTYWRDRSAASVLLAEPDWVDDIDGDVVHLSGVTLQLTSPASRPFLLRRLNELRHQGSWISFDVNYRAAGWPSAAAAAAVMDEFCAVSTVVFSSGDDERLLRGVCDPQGALGRIAGLGAGEVVVRDGADGAYVLAGGEIEHAPAVAVERVVDTTSAGDAFTGGYLAARLSGHAPGQAAEIANRVAAVVIQHTGAIAPSDVPLAHLPPPAL
jgi:2-dehydro-3-deoxygluconokinase